MLEATGSDPPGPDPSARLFNGLLSQRSSASRAARAIIPQTASRARHSTPAGTNPAGYGAADWPRIFSRMRPSPGDKDGFSPGKHDEAKAIAFPLLALKGQAPASAGSHVSHSSHVSGSGPGHVSHVSHVSRLVGPRPVSSANGDHAAAQPESVVQPSARCQRGPPVGRPPSRRSRAARRVARRAVGAAAPVRAMVVAARSSSSRRSAPSGAGSGGSAAEGGRDDPAGRRA